MLERDRDHYQDFWIRKQGEQRPHNLAHRLAPWKIYEIFKKAELFWDQDRRTDWVRMDLNAIEEEFGRLEFQRILKDGTIFLWTVNYVVSYIDNNNYDGEIPVAYPRSWIQDM